MLAFLDNTDEALAGLLRPGNAGSNTAADHITVTDLAPTRIPDTERYGFPILIRADGAGATRAWLLHLRRLCAQNLDVEFSLGFTMTPAVRAAIHALPKSAWTPAIEADGSVRDGADVAEITGLLDCLTAAGWPDGMRVIVRRDWPHPGASCRCSTSVTACATKPSPLTPVGQLAHLEARHRAHGRVEDRIRQAKDAGVGRFPSRLFTLNAAWLELALTGLDLIDWTQHLLLDGDLARCEPKALRYRLLHTAARITYGQRRTSVRLAEHWTWARDLAAAFVTLALIPHALHT